MGLCVMSCAVLCEVCISVSCPARGMEFCVSVLSEIRSSHGRGCQGLLKCNAVLSGSLVNVWDAPSAFGTCQSTCHRCPEGHN